MNSHQRSDLQRIAGKAMLDHGLEVEFSAEALDQLHAIRGPSVADGEIEDLRSMLWCSIDNDDSEDLDQLTVAENLGNGAVRILVAVADVDALVAKDTPIDRHASKNTVSVYVAGHVYPMLPERLSTDLTSLNPDVDRVGLVIAYVVKPDGSVGESSVSRALVQNRAKLAYNAVAAWLDGQGPLPEPAARVPGMDAQLRVQDGVAAQLRRLRHERGALDLQSLESRAVFSDDGKRMALNTTESLEVIDLSGDYPRRAMTTAEKRLPWRSICLSPDGNRLLCGGDNRAWLFDASSGALLRTFEETERFANMYEYPNGGFWNSLANVAKDWAGMVTDRFKGGNQLEVAFAEGGSRVITHTSGQILRVWDAESGKLLHTIHTDLPEKRNPRGEIRNSITLSANGRFAFACNGDNHGPAGLWSLTDGTLLRKYQLPQSSWTTGAPQDDGKAVFVPLTLPGEQARVRITEDKRGYATAEAEEILHAAPQRIVMGE